MFDLTGKTALVTGGNSGVGLAFAKGLLKSNANVVIWGRSKEKNSSALALLKEYSENIRCVQCDVTETDSIASAFQESVEHFGALDSCFANAGGPGPSAPLVDVKLDDWRAAINLNLDSVMVLYQHMIRHLVGRKAPGKLIVTSSEAAVLGTATAAAYGTTKAAVLGLTRAVAVEVGGYGITANAILPGFIETEFVKKTSDAFKQGALRRSCIGRVGYSEDMEGVAVFLSSSSSDLMTGQGIMMDGGHSIHPL